MFTIHDYLAIIAGSLAVLIALVIILISFRGKYKSSVFTMRLTAVILIVLGVLSLSELFI